MTCGDNGGTTAGGSPCRRPTPNGSKCSYHADPAENKAGRPRKDVDSHGVDTVETLAAEGMTQTVISSVLGMAPRTFQVRLNDDPEVKAAYARGRGRYECRIVKRLYRIATQKRSLKESRQACQFILERQFGWHRTERREHSGEIQSGVMRVPEPIGDTPDEWEEVARQLEARGSAVPSTNGRG